MQTNFSEDQLKNKDNKSTEKILRKCVHCGMCNATCPTFNLLGDELDGPRGRIYLIKFHNGMASSTAACFIIRNRSEGSALRR